VAVAIVIFTAIIYRWISLERLQRVFLPAEVTATPTPTPEPSPTRPPVITGKIETAKLFNGITVHTTVETPPGADASTERADPESYVLELKLRARVPAPNRTIDELGKVTPQLGTVLPGLSAMIGPASVSSLYMDLYATKVKALRDNLGRLDQLLSRHNFYDCQTVLQLQHPQSHRKALLLQADMDVDADGRIVKFTEKPKQAASTLASMGIYVFCTDFLLDYLERDGNDPNSAHDFAKNLIPQMVAKDNVFAYPFSGYWVDVGTIQSYWETSLALLTNPGDLNLWDPNWVIHTRSQERPPP
jgi:hypothetical protein